MVITYRTIRLKASSTPKTLIYPSTSLFENKKSQISVLDSKFHSIGYNNRPIKVLQFIIIFHQHHNKIDISYIQPKGKATIPTEETYSGGSNEECINVKNVS